jgi:D-alanyl-D-alanine carboxypeptidase
VTRRRTVVGGPHGHGYHPDANGVPRDVDRLNATIGAEGAISTAHDVSANRAAEAVLCPGR